MYFFTLTPLFKYPLIFFYYGKKQAKLTWKYDITLLTLVLYSWCL